MANSARYRTALGRSIRQPSAFAAYYEQHAEELLTFFVRRTFDVEVARDLLAETFAKAFQHRGQFRGTTDEEAAGWLFGIARHELSRYIRRGKVQRKAVDALGIEIPQVHHDDHTRIVELAGLAELRSSVAAAFLALSPEQRAAVRLRVVDEASYQDIARRLSVTEQAARARVSRGLRKLADSLDRERFARSGL